MEILEYETVWSGALEAAGAVPGLSSFEGRSQLAPQHAMIFVEYPTAADDAGLAEPVARALPFRASWDRSRDREALALLEQGLSLSAVARKLGSTKWCIRRVAVRHGVKLGPAGWDTPRSYRGVA